MRHHRFFPSALLIASTLSLMVLSGCGDGSEDLGTNGRLASGSAVEPSAAPGVDDVFGSPPLALRGPQTDADSGYQPPADPTP
nr:hypothetical protein [Variovorax boronicumulans]